MDMPPPEPLKVGKTLNATSEFGPETLPHGWEDLDAHDPEGARLRKFLWPHRRYWSNLSAMERETILKEFHQQEQEPLMSSSHFNETKAQVLGTLSADDAEAWSAAFKAGLSPAARRRFTEGQWHGMSNEESVELHRKLGVLSTWVDNHLPACGVDFRGCAPGCPKDEAEAQEDGRTSIRCNTCGKRSNDPDDVRQKFCAICKGYHQSPESYEIIEGRTTQ